ncbi:MAG TPA: hypothetical protein PLH23_00760 [Hyphomonadaceae bacterium]|nr:hypothetical protein [Hyphomonadaceae bacterium]HPI46768.1 hypothetical protein [Hyphomonadaceae bacterium]
MGHTVRLRGEFWPQDHWGRVTNAAIAREQVAQPALEAAEEAADVALERFGDRLHSVYLSGPAARGRPGGAAFFVLLRLGASDARSNESWESAVAAQIRRRHPRIGRVAVAVFNWKDVFTTDGAFSPARFRLAVNSVCVAGRNMTRMLAPQRIDTASMNGDILGFRPRMLNAAGRLAAARSPDRVRAAAMDAGHAVLAASFALVMEREQIYTEDLDLRRDLFTLNYPGRTRDLAEAYAMATRPSPDAMKALVFIDSACRWLTPMTDAWLNANNPQRTERLKA